MVKEEQQDDNYNPVMWCVSSSYMDNAIPPVDSRTGISAGQQTQTVTHKIFADSLHDWRPLQDFRPTLKL